MKSIVAVAAILSVIGCIALSKRFMKHPPVSYEHSAERPWWYVLIKIVAIAAFSALCAVAIWSQL